MKKISLCIITLFTLQYYGYAQSVIEPLDKSVYHFIDLMNDKGIISHLPVLKPYTRNDIVKYLMGIDGLRSELNDIEKSELDWYQEEYYSGNIFTPDLQSAVFNNKNRSRFFYYSDSLFSFYLSPAISEAAAFLSQNKTKLFSWGINSYGSVGNLGFRFNFSENSRSSDKLLSNDYYSDEQGRVISRQVNNITEFTNSDGSLIFQNSFLTVGIVKEEINIGSGNRSQLILSGKAPSFPSLYLKFDPVNWLQIYFMHGWLHSSAIDSSRTYNTEFIQRTVELDKYYVMHALQLNPWSNFSLTLGETIIYSDKSIYLGYFLPFVFYRSVDHSFTYAGEDSGDNGSFFSDIVYRPFPDLKLYSTLFIDEFSIAKLLKGDSDRNQFGYTFGLTNYGFFDNLSCNIEYTKILPWVYSNWIPSQTYTNSTFLLGHYIGQNADQLYINLGYTFTRGLKASLWTEYIRRGGISPVSNQYNPPGEKFLYGLRRNDFNWGINVSYEYTHDLKGNFFYRYSNISDEDINRTPLWQLGGDNQVGVSLSYGL